MEVIEDKKLKRKIKLNLLIVFIISSIMFFGGFISAYIVSKGDSYWMKVEVPDLFYFNTLLLFIVSILVYVALKNIKKGKIKQTKRLIGFALIVAILFFILQVKAWNIMLDRGIAPINKNVVVFKGKYGEYFKISYRNKILTLDGNDYLLDENKINKNLRDSLTIFANQFLKIKNNGISIANYGNPFTLLYNDSILKLENKSLNLNGQKISNLAFERLQDLMKNITNGRGDFFAKGKYGKDFTLYYKTFPIEYKNRKYYYKGEPLSVPMKLLLNDTDDKATAYFYLITFMHWLHAFAGIIILIYLFIKCLRGRYTKFEYTGIETGGLFWHFLDILWLFLFLFLIFIH